MTREDEYTVTFSSGKIVVLISVALCAMLACFIVGLVVGKSAQPQLSAPTPAPAPAPEPEPALTKQPAPKISLPEVPKSSEPARATTAPKKAVAKKPAPKPVQKAPSVSKELYTLCVISVRSKDGAQDYANQLAKKGYKTSVIRTQSKSGTIWYRTVIGEFPSREIAEEQLTALKSKGEFKDAFVISK